MDNKGKMRISDSIREYANSHQVDEWSVFELAFLHTHGYYDEGEINKAYRRWFSNGSGGGEVDWWLRDFIRREEVIEKARQLLA